MMGKRSGRRAKHQRVTELPESPSARQCLQTITIAAVSCLHYCSSASRQAVFLPGISDDGLQSNSW